jgi:hypothetical protein
MKSIKDQQVKYYSELFHKYKGEPQAVSSESFEHKRLRYDRLSRIFKEDNNCSIHDVGMGMGHFYEYIKKELPSLSCTYSGTEIVEDYYSYCLLQYPENNFYLRDLAEKPGEDSYDYVVLSGVFHQMQGSKRLDWENFMEAILTNVFAMSKKGIALNLVSGFVDFYQPNIYYSNLCKLTHFINDKLSRFFAIDHSYALYEQTVFVYQPEFVISQFPQNEFQKYFKRS